MTLQLEKQREWIPDCILCREAMSKEEVNRKGILVFKCDKCNIVRLYFKR